MNRAQEIMAEVGKVGNWMTVERHNRKSIEALNDLYRESAEKLERLHKEFKSLRLSEEERMHTGLLNKSLEKSIQANRAGSKGKYRKAERLMAEAEQLAGRYYGMVKNR
jgi:NAD(P)H-nitrite reductase large subunit